MNRADPPPPEVLAAFGLEGASVSPIPVGLIHRTFKVGAFALQAVNAIFVPEVHLDIEAVTTHLALKGLITPRLRRTRAGELFLRHGGEIWRALDWIDGETIEKIGAPSEARSAAVLLAGFHRALADLQHTFKSRRLGVHDTKKHLAVLEDALDQHRDHRLYARVEPIAREIFERTAALPDFSAIPERTVHGDPKISNVIFEPGRRSARALVDLDTVAPMALPLELGDAFRSWCNPAGEDASRVAFDRAIFEAAIEGYAEGARGSLGRGEIEAILPATGTIMLELSARFAADALNERYFGWNSARYATRGEHNLVRAEGQLTLAKDFARHRDDAERALEHAFA